MSFTVKDPGAQRNVSDQAIEAEKWIWCQICHQCYQHGEYRIVKGIQLCPYDECLGVIFVNGWPWSRIQKKYAGSYPIIPERNVVYPYSVG